MHVLIEFLGNSAPQDDALTRDNVAEQLQLRDDGYPGGGASPAFLRRDGADQDA